MKKPMTDSQRRASQINWALYTIAGAIGTLAMIAPTVPTAALDEIRKAVLHLRGAQELLRLHNEERKEHIA